MITLTITLEEKSDGSVNLRMEPKQDGATALELAFATELDAALAERLKLATGSVPSNDTVDRPLGD